MANTKPVDKTKKSNVKCEHCKWWQLHKSIYTKKCRNKRSPKHDMETNYWNRCKCFDWN